MGRRGKPGMAVSDRAIESPLVRMATATGAELTGNVISIYGAAREILGRHIAPGKPMQNRFADSFNGRMRAEFLNDTMICNMAHARDAARAWPPDDKIERPHSAPGCKRSWRFPSASLSQPAFNQTGSGSGRVKVQSQVSGSGWARSKLHRSHFAGCSPERSQRAAARGHPVFVLVVVDDVAESMRLHDLGTAVVANKDL